MRSVFVERPAAAEMRRRLAGWQGRLWVWLPVMVALVAISVESTKTFSAANTSSWLRPVFERIFGHINDALWNFGHHCARKAGHFFGYGMVCVTFLRAWLMTLARSASLRDGVWRWQANGLAVLCTVLVASADEVHQTFLPGRTGAATDVVIDTAGGMAISGAVWLGAMWIRRRSRRVELVAA